MTDSPLPAPEADPEPSEPGSDGATGRVARLRARGQEEMDRATTWLERRRVEQIPVDLAVQYYERDRDSFASVLGAAIALRLFLFFVPIVVVVVALVLLIGGQDAMTGLTEQAGVTGSLAAEIDSATTTTTNTTVGLLLGGLWLLLWAGRSLTKVLAACSAGAWRMDGRQGKATIRMAATVTILILGILMAGTVINRIKEEQGIAVATTSFVIVAVVYGVGWFLVSASLPRRTTDPGALLPGAIVVAASLAGLQWFMQYYLPTRLEHSTAVAGTLGVSLAALGYMFLIGRVMASSLILDAVVYERVGSVSGLIFALPVLQRIPHRFPKVARYFDLERVGAEVPEPAAGEGPVPPAPPVPPGPPAPPTAPPS